MNIAIHHRAPWRDGWVEYSDQPHAGDTGGLVLVLVHGLGGSREHFAALMEQWTSSRVIALDLPGFGTSTPIRGAVTINDLVDSVNAVLDHAQVGEVLFVGHSMGGPIGLRYAAADAGRVHGVVLLCGTVQNFTATLGGRLRPWRVAPMTAFTTVIELISVATRLPQALTKVLAKSRLGRALTLWPFVQFPATLDPDTALMLMSGAGAPGALPTARALGRLGAWDDIDASAFPPLYAINGAADRIAPRVDLESFGPRLADQHVLDTGHMAMLEDTGGLTAALSKIYSELKTSHG
ncbi:alpha/beta fold hydrolase [Mycolicibacterium farcinogenes]|uniref:Alpha/beta hydrolase n=1 Tax=Mycolicibacterium farcinogenes TaxID=1802 RepID=A0ACD1FQV4_MYCFR|nr:alpha/beta hydrolase [Mycolicibacterium farcinogenes]QZH69444.1 alpha/beta hydrolase [Mycolicibacterium farcinogenes]